MKKLFHFVCFLVLCGCSLQEFKETLDNPQKLFQSEEKENAELSRLNSTEYQTEVYKKTGYKQTVQLPENCSDFAIKCKQINKEAYYAGKKNRTV